MRRRYEQKAWLKDGTSDGSMFSGDGFLVDCVMCLVAHEASR